MEMMEIGRMFVDWKRKTGRKERESDEV